MTCMRGNRWKAPVNREAFVRAQLVSQWAQVKEMRPVPHGVAACSNRVEQNNHLTSCTEMSAWQQNLLG